MNIRLVNPRGMVIEVDEKEVPELLSQGFLKVTNPEVKDYVPAFDQGDPNYSPQKQMPTTQPVLGDELPVRVV